MPPPLSPPARHRDNGGSADHDDADHQRPPRPLHRDVERPQPRESFTLVHGGQSSNTFSEPPAAPGFDVALSSARGEHPDFDPRCLASIFETSSARYEDKLEFAHQDEPFLSGEAAATDLYFDGDDERDDDQDDEIDREETHVDDDDYGDDSDVDSVGDPVHHLHHLSTPSDFDLDMSDSDGGVPLHDFALFSNPDGFQLDLELDFDPDLYFQTDDSVEHHGLGPNTTITESLDNGHHSPSFFSFALLNAHQTSLLTMDDDIPGVPWADDLMPPMQAAIISATDALQTYNPQPPFLDAFADTFPPVQLSNPNPTILGSENLSLVDFLRDWAHRGSFSSHQRSRPPHLHEVHTQARTAIKDVTYEDLQGDECDFQGLNWTSMETTRADARARRRRTYKNYVNRAGSDALRVEHRRLPSRDSFFRFSKMHMRSDVSLAHFQLRSVLACPGRTHAYYSSPSGINRMNLASKKTELVLNLREFPAMGGIISTLDADHGILMGGTFNGDYCIQALDSQESKSFSEGQISPDGITNHIKVHTARRSARPVASIASNDRGFRVMDIETEVFTSQTTYDFAMNSSALSPDRRLRALVGDDPLVLIVDADTGETLRRLNGHHDYGFSCDWSDDGWTVATGFQDKSVKIWDARRWCNSNGVSTPLRTIRSELAGVRGLRFSPLGSGHPVLVAAEEADFINLIDAQTFTSKQTIDVFSEIGGIAFANEGQDLNILCCDANRGGLLQLARCGGDPGMIYNGLWRRPASWHRRALTDDDGDEDPWHNKWTRNRRPTLLQGPEPF
ncbi:hypothetical protein HIM_03905 [Hirsutella minnesotensis 3608]|uniref:Uncharacterized protein n=1 Tax=Hirsutella minnesotensis 3608 TaxID=1043627 RepID=A0A0F8A671_9HYPO|nr:hypothetical protein HIM_03905 [Hirsutella minnesotensis 3608]